ncbi:HyaD/HybD family hydrogenase maturation endopeptidase [Anaerobacillus isosaccharinicus]|uniref:Hydrogenase maturation protease n=2 Tax=Anaerobacillus isosaccharinicus TaxID=1532552 RepID=A0A1S2LG34_9BACI|nr:HyaD/HybD family hydrogenase maturation endopeptidase [Anaerobacillus isosaccharinicus]MBA5585950.1 HyaD/HybD family hydrogenase maturation endopeptidase [Anaerobacillus isosaccharinicus]
MTCNQLEKKTKKITILGIGNTLYSDEGVGVHILPLLHKVLKDKSEEEVEIIEGATDGMRLLGPVEDTDYLIIIDAINAGKEPGTIISIKNDDIPAYFGIKMSIHQVGFQEVLFAARIRERLPEEMIMFGIQPESLKLGLELTSTVNDRLIDLANQIKSQVDTWSDKIE